VTCLWVSGFFIAYWLHQAALLSSVVSSALAWPVVNPLPWFVRALWLAALLFSLMSISIAAQQAIAITRVSNQELALEPMKLLLGKPCPSLAQLRTGTKVNGHNTRDTAALEASIQTRWKPVPMMVYIWQIPSMLLGNAILIFIVGLASFLFSNARAATGWGDDQKVGVFFGCFMAFAAANYLLNWIYIERRVQLGNRSQNQQ
jgi:hypothetical protein